MRKDNSNKKDDNKGDPPLQYFFGICLNIVLALILGALTNHGTNIVGDRLGFDIHINITNITCWYNNIIC